MTRDFNRLAFLENLREEASQGALGTEQSLREEVLDLRSQLAVAQSHTGPARLAHPPIPDAASAAALLRENAELRETVQRLRLAAESAAGPAGAAPDCGRAGRSSAPAMRGEADDAGWDALGRDGPETALGAAQVRPPPPPPPGRRRRRAARRR